MLEAFGWDPSSWRLDETPHPFASKPGAGDIRLTTHTDERDITSLFSTMHEYGHGLTWRMIGGMSGPLAGALGEGAAGAHLLGDLGIEVGIVLVDALEARRLSRLDRHRAGALA